MCVIFTCYTAPRMSFGGAQLLQSEHCKLPIKTPGVINFLRDFDGLIYGKTSNCIEKKNCRT